jgi:hypothetical protein
VQTALEKLLISTHKKDMISYINANPAYFEELIRLILSGKNPYSWRAAWFLWSCMAENDQRVICFIPEWIGILAERPVNQKRELLKILWLMDIDETLEGLLFDQCVDIWEQINHQPSVRFNAFKLLLKIAKKHPELSVEISALTDTQYIDTLSPGARKSVLKMMRSSEIGGGF